MINYRIIVLFFIFFNLSAFSQNENDLQRDLKVLLKATDENDYDLLLDYIGQKLFELVPREAMIEQLKKTLEDDKFSLGVSLASYKLIKPITEIEGNKYAIVQVEKALSFTFKNEENEESDSSYSTLIGLEFMAELYKQQFGKNNVTIDTAAKSIVVKSTSENFAIFNKELNHFTFLELSSERKDFLFMMYPETIFKKLKYKFKK